MKLRENLNNIYSIGVQMHAKPELCTVCAKYADAYLCMHTYNVHK